jgi:orotate phosphoribosyltransferase
VLKALSALREAGAQVVKVLALVDREEGGRSAIEGEGVPFHAFFTIEEILSAYKAQKSILGNN